MTTYFKDLHSDVAPKRHLKALASQRGLYASVFKRFFDIAFVLFAAPIAIPLVLFASLIVALDGGIPYYWQKRVGLNGREFRMFKLRTMVPDAERALEDYLEANPESRKEWDETQKLRNDHRVTWVGKFLRKSSIDELPQLWNVLMGDMSVVGPRPFMVSQRELYAGHAYYSLRPGITGIWQISDRNECNFSERVVFDDHYYKRLSFGMDLSILVRTVSVVLRCTGH